MSLTVAEKRATFRTLHTEGCFVIPNPWDIGSARYLQSLGFKALASTSSGHDWSQGHADGQLALDRVLAHLRALVEATDLPINADFEDGFADDPEGVARNVGLAVQTGVAGLSIEDASRQPEHPLRPLDDAVARLQAAREAIDASGTDTLLVGRAENFIVGRPNLDDTLCRLQAYARAGADCLYAPGIHTPEQIRAVVQAVAPKPVNLLIGGPSTLTLETVAQLGVRRISVGGGLARVAWGALKRAASGLQAGHFDGFSDAMDYRELNGLFTDSKTS